MPDAGTCVLDSEKTTTIMRSNVGFKKKKKKKKKEKF